MPAPASGSAVPLRNRIAGPAALLLAALSPGGAEVIDLGFDRVSWRFESQGRYLEVADPRGLRQIFHPWAEAEAGDYGALTTRVRLPADWRGPVWLNLFAEDTYVGDGWDQARERWTHTYASAHHFAGHRFKQVLADGRLVWERDVGDAEGPGSYVQIELAGLSPGDEFDLTLRIFDRVASGERLPGDEFFLGVWSWDGLADPEEARKKFYTRLFLGDVALSPEPLPWERNPARRPVPFAPVARDPAPPAAGARHTFRLDAPGGLPPEGYPATWGVPFARGRLPDPGRVRLTGAAGEALPLQTRVLTRWDDGSVRWLLLDFPARAADREGGLTLEYGAAVEPAPAAGELTAVASAEGVSVDTGVLSFRVRRGSESLIEAVELGGRRLAEDLAARVVTRDGWERTPFLAVADSVAVEEAGSERVAVLATGMLSADGGTLGRFSLRVHAYRGRPWIRLFFRIFNDTDPPAQLVEEISLRLQTSLKDGEAVAGLHRSPTGDSEMERLLVRQHRADGFEVFGGDDRRKERGTHWEAPMALEAGGLGVAGRVRHFRQLYPKRMWAGQGGQLVFDLFTPTIEYEQYVMSRGEARRHELLLCFYEGGLEPHLPAFEAFASPPALISPEWYAGNGALGLGAPLTAAADGPLHELIAAGGAPGLACTQPLGLRNWPDHYSDSVYSAYRGTWGNMYQEVDYGALAVSLLAGRRDFFDYAEAYQRHFIDLDICHYHPDPTLVGASYGIAPYHTGSRPYALNAPVSGLFLLWSLTGDQDAFDAAGGIADWLVKEAVGVGAGSGRAAGWPLRSAVIAWEYTGRERYLDFAAGLAGTALKQLHPRLGHFSEPPATWHYRGGIPGMNAILSAGLMRYWRASGDEEVGRAVSQLAHDMAYSWMSPLEPGFIYGNDPLQHVYLVAYALQDVLPLFWGYELTGETAFLDKARQVMEACILAEEYRGQALGLSRYWELQDVLHYRAVHRRLQAGD